MSEWHVSSPLASQDGKNIPAEAAREDEPLMALTVNVHGDKSDDVEVRWQTSASAQGKDRNRLVRAAIEALRRESARIAED